MILQAEKVAKAVEVVVVEEEVEIFRRRSLSARKRHFPRLN